MYVLLSSFVFIVINCGGLCDLEKGTVLISHSTIGGVATYTCKPGYELEGSNRRECMPNGEWSESEPNCKGIHKVIYGTGMWNEHR